MAEYIEREAAFERIFPYPVLSSEAISKENVVPWMIGVGDAKEQIKAMLKEIPAADVVEASTLKEFAEDVAYQFGYAINCNGRLHLSSGGLSTLEWAFAILGWKDPKLYPEGECEWDGCHEYASCGTPTPDGYMRVCGKHYADIQARKEAEENARMDGE